MPPKLIIEVVGDTSGLDRSFKRASRTAQGFSRDINQASRGAIVATGAVRGLGRSVVFASGAFLGSAGIVFALRSSVEAASNLAEQMSKTNVVFGDAATDVKAWSKTTVEAMGLAEDQALATASSFGALLAPLGIVGSQAAKQSEQLTQLGADLASFYNTSVQDALDAIRSGLVGESEPLRRYGVLLSETRVQQEALRQTGKRYARDLTAQEKVLARQALIFQDTRKAQGDFQRTSAGLANQQRILAANIRELQIRLGQALIPAVTRIVTKMNEWLGKTENQERVQRDINEAAEAGAKVFTTLAAAIDKTSDAYGRLKSIKGPSLRDLPGADFSILDYLRGGHGPSFLDFLSNRSTTVGRAGGQPFGYDPFAAPNALRDLVSDAQRSVLESQRPPQTAAGAAAPRRPGVSQSLRNLWFDNAISRMLDRAQDVTGLKNRKAELGRIADLIRAQMTIVKDTTRRLNLEDQLVSVLREQRDLQDQITAGIKEANQALKDRADAIKSAVLDRLQRRQTDILNRRALDDARAALRVARQIGGPAGIEAARRGVQDVQFDIQRARLERAPASLGGGRFALGNVITINVNGADSPDEVARKVVTRLQRQGRHQTKQTRGPFSNLRVQ